MQASISVMDTMLTGSGLALPVSIALQPSGQSINYTNSVPFRFTDSLYIVRGSFTLLMLRARLTTEVRESTFCYVHILLHLSLNQNSSNLTRFYRVVNCNSIGANPGIRLEEKSDQEVLISSQKPGEWADIAEAALQTA